ncbi:MAG TPA: nitrous oxide reductase accessory protein NosL [Vicinamibacterales bacterium]
MSPRLVIVALALAAASCAGLPEPVDISGSEACTHCRMTVSDVHVAAQVVARGEEPIFFDDIGCLANWLKDAQPRDRAVVFVADHRTGHWVVAQHAVYTRAPHVATPMGSGIIAHVDAGSRDQDPAARGGTGQTIEQVFGNKLPVFGDAP